MARSIEETRKAKRQITDDEFIKLCSDVMRWIGKRIQEHT